MYTSILVPFDNSDHAQNALAQAIMLAKTCDAKVTALSVADLPDFNDPGYTVAARMAGVAQIPEDQLQELQREFNSVQEKNLVENTEAIAGDFDRMEYRATAGKAHDVIVEFAESGDYDLIVMGCRGLGALRGALGSVSYAVARSVKIPVMLVK